MSDVQSQTDQDTEVIDLAEALFDNSLRVERAIHVPTMLAGVATSDLLGDIEMGDLDDAAPLLGVTADDLRTAADEEELGWFLRDVKGWLIEVSAAKYGPWSKGASRSRPLYEGVRAIRWFKADTYEEAVQAAVAWVESEPPELLWVRGGEVTE